MSALDPRVNELIQQDTNLLLDEIRSLLGMERLDPETIYKLLPHLVDSPFINDEEPMDFATFSIALDDTPLSDHQIGVLKEAGVLTAWGVISPYRKVRTLYAAWGKGTLVKGTVLTDTVTGESHTVEVWCTLGKQLPLRTMSPKGEVFETVCGPVFCKGVAQTYTVSLTNGKSVSVSSDHRFLVCEGDHKGYSWKKCSELIPGLSRVLSISDTSHVYDTYECHPLDLTFDTYDYRPLYRLEDGGVEFDLGYRISPIIQDMLDHFCTLPQSVKEALQNRFAYEVQQGGLEELGDLLPTQSTFEWLHDCNLEVYLSGKNSNRTHTSIDIPDQVSSCSERTSCLTPVLVSSILQFEHTEIYDLTVPVTNCYFDDQGILHHNSGKDWLAARFIAWFVYVIFHMKAPKKWFRPRVKIVEDERIDIINVAPKGKLAEEVFFEYLSRNFRRDIFKPYVLNERTQILTNKIIFPQLNLQCISMNSSSSGLDGYNPLLWIMDEADAFLDNGNKSNAEVLGRILASSAGTRWPGMWLGWVLSYMRSGAGYMARQITKFAKHPQPGVFVDQAASWEVNPNISRDDDDIRQAYWEDPIAAAAMYEGKIPPVINPFFTRYEYIRESVGGQRTPVIYSIHNQPGELITRELNGKDKEFIWIDIEHVQPEPGRRYYGGVDAGEEGDSFAICVVSVADDNLLGPQHVCPRCYGLDPTYYKEAIGGYEPVETSVNHKTIACDLCGVVPGDFHYQSVSNAQMVSGWWHRISQPQGFSEVTINGETIRMPHFREDVRIVLDPIKRGANPNIPDGAAVDFLSVQNALDKMCRGLSMVSLGLDPHQMSTAIQYLSANTNTEVGKESFSNPEQFKRLRLVRYLMYSALVILAGEGVCSKEIVEKGCVEFEQLQKIGQRIDHPLQGSKDIVDALAIAIKRGAEDNIGQGVLEWLFREKTGKELGAPKS